MLFAWVMGILMKILEQYVLLLRAVVPSWKPFITSQNSNAY
jgi:hypothetical protein